MPIEETIYRDFRFDGLHPATAVHRLIGAGYSREDAEDVVSEWQDELEWEAEKAQRP